MSDINAPWKAEHIFKASWKISNADAQVIAFVEREEIARLIEVAPDLLKALVEMVNGPECGEDASEVRKNAIAAIKKARGEE